MYIKHTVQNTSSVAYYRTQLTPVAYYRTQIILSTMQLRTQVTPSIMQPLSGTCSRRRVPRLLI